MNIIKTEMDKVLILEPEVFEDHRGWFYLNHIPKLNY